MFLLEEAYNSLGLYRRLCAYSLKSKGQLHAVLFVNQASPGVNLSGILNGIKVFVTTPKHLPKSILFEALRELAVLYKEKSIPVMIYPNNYVSESGIRQEKDYYAWIYNGKFIEKFIAYMQRELRLPLY